LGFAAWWRLYCEHRQGWEDEDFGSVLAELEKRPPNRQLLSPIVASFLAGLVQAGGEVGFLRMREAGGKVLHVPYVLFRCDSETARFVLRQVGDAFSGEGRRSLLSLYVTGLRAVILLKILEPYLRGAKKSAAGVAALCGYRVSGGRLVQALRDAGIAYHKRYRVVGGRKIQAFVPAG
jgi:hypothetical protein